MSGDRWIQVNPVIFQGRNFAPQENQAFVIMPFGPRWSKVVWETVRSALKETGFSCIRADEQYGHQVLEDIWRGICEATIVIADVTGRNPNVYYELGIAHVLGRRVILLTQDAADIPFDTRVYRHISYKNRFWSGAREAEMKVLSGLLKRHVEWIRDNETIPSSHPLADVYAALQDKRTVLDLDIRLR